MAGKVDRLPSQLLAAALKESGNGLRGIRALVPVRKVHRCIVVLLSFIIVSLGVPFDGDGDEDNAAHCYGSGDACDEMVPDDGDAGVTGHAAGNCEVSVAMLVMRTRPFLQESGGQGARRPRH